VRYEIKGVTRHDTGRGVFYHLTFSPCPSFTGDSLAARISEEQFKLLKGRSADWTAAEIGALGHPS
jgi:hypothetical protein